MQMLTKLQKFNLDVGSVLSSHPNTDFKTTHEKTGKPIFQEKVFHHTLLRNALPEDTLKHQRHVPLHKDLLLKSGGVTVFLMYKCPQSLLRENFD